MKFQQMGCSLACIRNAFTGTCLADRFNNIRKEKKSTKRPKEAQTLLLDHLKSQERLLKERVEEHFLALSKSNAALKQLTLSWKRKNSTRTISHNRWVNGGFITASCLIMFGNRTI